LFFFLPFFLPLFSSSLLRLKDLMLDDSARKRGKQSVPFQSGHTPHPGSFVRVAKKGLQDYFLPFFFLSFPFFFRDGQVGERREKNGCVDLVFAESRSEKSQSQVSSPLPPLLFSPFLSPTPGAEKKRPARARTRASATKVG